MSNVVHLLDRRTYSFTRVDELLDLASGTAQRWIDGYSRKKTYEPVIRVKSTGVPVATWGEFVECRALAEYREAGVPTLHLRTIVQRLRAELRTPYPLASARLWLRPEGQELLAQVQQQSVDGEDYPLLYVVRTDNMLLPFDWGWSSSAERFQGSVKWSEQPDPEPVALWADPQSRQVEINPLRSFGAPVVRGVQTARLAELARAGDPPEMLAEMYDLELTQVLAALDYEHVAAAA
jgi:uncharacterized protein (DUF433 family)